MSTTFLDNEESIVGV
jgi:hypothetical protein